MKSGLDDYLVREALKPKCLLCRIDRLLTLRDKFSLEVYSEGNIYFNPEIQVVYISEKKINLTQSESKIFRYMLDKEGYCTIGEFKKLLCGTVQEESIRILVCRLMKKMRYILGYSVIKNKYKKGYYIDA